MKITAKNGEKKVVMEEVLKRCDKCIFYDDQRSYFDMKYDYCRLFQEDLEQNKQCSQCKEELGELE